MRLRDVHVDSLATSTALAGFYDKRAIPPLEVISVLAEAAVRFMLVGTHAIGGWMRKPRATLDVDIIVFVKQRRVAIESLLAAFPQLEEEGQPASTRLGDRTSKGFSINVIEPQRPLLRAALKHSHTVHCEGLSYKIPSLELALAMKFASMTRLLWSEPDKYQEIHDFMRMAEMTRNVDFSKLAELGELVFKGGGPEVVHKVQQVQAGEKVVW